MSHRRPRGCPWFRLGFEALEGRRLPAQFGVPWHDPEHLTVSFVPDGTLISGDRSNLFRLLDAQEPTSVWQGQILQAFRTWAAAARVNFATVPDGGQPLGTPGPDQGDPRFGDIRIGARPMSPEVLSISVPHDPFLSGTWSGDILLNSNIAFGSGVDLVPVILHEVGHVLGLGESADPQSVMFGNLDNTKAALSAGDISAVQALYGPPGPDAFEGPGGNDTTETAAPLPTPAGYDGSTPLLLYANIAGPGDADVFSMQAPAGYSGSVTVRVQTAAVSLLAARLTVLDARGEALADVSTSGDAGGALRVTLPRVDPGAVYHIEVRAAEGDVLGMGKYALAVNFDGRSLAGPDAIDALMRQSYDYLSPDDLEQIFLDPRTALFRDDRHADDTLATATALQSLGVYGSEAPFRVTASLGDRSDVDVYRIETPRAGDLTYRSVADSRPLVMTVTVRLTEVNGLVPRVSVFDAGHRLVPAVVLAEGAGAFTIQVDDPAPESFYFLRVDHDPGAVKVAGNYDLDVEFGHQAAAPVDFVSGTLDLAHPLAEFDLVVSETQLFDFLLAAQAVDGRVPSGATIRLRLTDLRGRLVASRSATVGETAGGASLLLLPGVYHATFEVEPGGAAAIPPLKFRLYGASLSDPIGPALDDPTLSPVSDPGGVPLIGSPAAPYAWLARAVAARPDLPVPRDPGTEGINRSRSGSATPNPALTATAPIETRPSITSPPSAPMATDVLGLAAMPPARLRPAVPLGARLSVAPTPRDGTHGGVDGVRRGDAVLAAIVPERPDLEADAGGEPMQTVWRVSRRVPSPQPKGPPGDGLEAPAPRGPRVGGPSRWPSAALGFGPHAAALLGAAAVAYEHARRRRLVDRGVPITFRIPIAERSLPGVARGSRRPWRWSTASAFWRPRKPMRSPG